MKVTISNSTLNGKKIDGTYTGNNINLDCPDAQILDDTEKMAGKTIRDVRWAIDYANTHEQGFVVKMCCVKCGAVI